MFNQILIAFQGFFSRAFWFGNFLPVAVVAAVHIVLIEVVFPGTLPVTDWIAADDAAGTLTSFTLLVAMLVVLAYALSPMVPLVRELLDGRLLPSGVNLALRRDRVIAWYRRRKDEDSAMRLYGEMQNVEMTEVDRLMKERGKGLAQGVAPDEQVIKEARTQVRKFRRELLSGRKPNAGTAKEACDALAKALAANDSDYAGAVKTQQRNASQLTNLHRETVLLLSSATADAYYRFDLFSHLVSEFDLDRYQATRVGDARRLSERYSESAYGVPHHFLWPRLPLVVGDPDKGFPQRLSDAQSMVEFSVLALALAMSVPAVWLLPILLTQETPWLFLGIGIASPIVLRFFYEMVVQSQIAFGQTVKGAVDQYRLDLLTKTLRQPMPATLSAERELWKKLRKLEDDNNTVELVYERKTQGAETAE